MTTRPGAQLEPSSTYATFAEMICQDDELLDAEFAAIVAAEWSCLPPPGVVTVAPRMMPPGPAAAVRPGPVVSGVHPPYVGECRSRQRAPPTQLPSHLVPVCPADPGRASRPGSSFVRGPAMVERPDPYAELGVAADATQPEIHEAFRRRLRQHHPDTRRSAGPADDRESDDALQRLLAAYAALSRRRSEPAERTVTAREAGRVVRARRGRPTAEHHGIWVSQVLWEPAGQKQPQGLQPLRPGPPLSGAIAPALFLRWLLGDRRRR